MSIETTSEFFSVPRPFSKTVYPNTCNMFILWNSTKIRSLFVLLSDLSCFRQQSEIIYVKIKINLIRNNIIENLFFLVFFSNKLYVCTNTLSTKSEKNHLLKRVSMTPFLVQIIRFQELQGACSSTKKSQEGAYRQEIM